METSDSKEKDLKDEMYDDPNFCDEEGGRHGAYRDIFKKFKGSFEKIFITDVSPVTLDDVNTNDQGLQATCKHVCKQTIRHSFNCHLRFRLPKTTISCTYIYEIMYFKLRICLPTSTKPFTLMNVKY